MKIKEAKFKKVQVWQTKEVSPDVFGCDECRQEIKDWLNEDGRLEITIFHHNTEVMEPLHFCSWNCVLRHIPKIDTDHFVSLPFILFDIDPESPRSAKSLKDLLNKLT